MGHAWRPTPAPPALMRADHKRGRGQKGRTSTLSSTWPLSGEKTQRPFYDDGRVFVFGRATPVPPGAGLRLHRGEGLAISITYHRRKNVFWRGGLWVADRFGRRLPRTNASDKGKWRVNKNYDALCERSSRHSKLGARGMAGLCSMAPGGTLPGGSDIKPSTRFFGLCGFPQGSRTTIC